MAEGGEGVGACSTYDFEGASEDEALAVRDEAEMTRLCYAGGGRWVVVHYEDVERVWHGPSPERALAAYLRERLERAGEEEGEEACEEYLARARRAREEGDLGMAEGWERVHRECLQWVEERRRVVRLLRSAAEGLRTGRIKLKLKPLQR